MQTKDRGIRSQLGQWGLIGMLVALLIIGILFVMVLLPKMKSASGTRQKTTPQAAMEQAKDVECMSNLRSIREALVMYKNENDTLPPTLADLKIGVRPDFFKCPVGGEVYQYDPSTGTARCIHSGHEGY